MTTQVKLAGFAAALAVLFGGGAVAGGAIDPDRSGDVDGAAPHAGAAHQTDRNDQAEVPAGHTETTASVAAENVRGLAVAHGGLRVVVDDPELRRGRRETVRFRVVDERGATVRDFDVEHEKRMHLIVARRDLSTFQHLHPVQSADGSWSTDITLDEASSYRLFADFSTAGEARTLATDLRVDGDADLRPLPEPRPVAQTAGGYEVRLDAQSARAGGEAELAFTVTKGGETVHTEPYLGAGGHLVALRDGDLAFLHVHPAGHGASADEHDDAVRFAATFPTEGRYRLFLQFKHEGRVQTAAFTQEVTR